MPSNFYDLLKYAKTGIAAPSMNNLDKIRALSLAGGYPLSTITGVPPLAFRADGIRLTAWSIYGNGQQTGTPAPDNPIMPTFCGKLVESNWTIPITCAGQTVPVYLGQAQTVKRIKKFVLTGEENDWGTYTIQDGSYCAFLPLQNFFGASDTDVPALLICSHYMCRAQVFIYNGTFKLCCGGRTDRGILIRDINITSEQDLKSYLAAQYSAGTPVTVWYVLATPETGIVNEPLAKIGNYADELHSEDAGVTIPTTRGRNTLTVGTDLQPSSVSITGHIKLT